MFVWSSNLDLILRHFLPFHVWLIKRMCWEGRVGKGVYVNRYQILLCFPFCWQLAVVVTISLTFPWLKMARLLRKAKNQKLFDRDFKTSDEIGKGSFGIIFKVTSEDGTVVAAAKYFDLTRFSKQTKTHIRSLKEVI